MKKNLAPIKVAEFDVAVSMEHEPHDVVHAIRFTATCGQTEKSGILTLNVPEGATFDDAKRDADAFAARLAVEAATRERTRLAKEKLLAEET